VLSHSLSLLGNPFVAAALGLALAVALIAVSRASFGRIRPETAERDVALAALALFARLASATIVLWAYKTYVPSGFKPFALTLAGGFLVLFTVEAVRFGGLHRYARPENVRQ
jgi:hypothetical protein